VDYLTEAIAGLIPTSTVTADAVYQLMEIYKQQARATRDAATAQKVLREWAQAERVIEDNHQRQQEAAAPKVQTQEHASPVPTFQVEDDNMTAPAPQAISHITQAEYDSPPSANT
jgi:hypothetical protein